MTSPKLTSFKRFFQDRRHHYAILQSPNLPIYAWATAKLLAHVTTGHLKTGFDQLSTVFIFTWAYLEFTNGDSTFRRVLGALVMLSVITLFLLAA